MSYKNSYLTGKALADKIRSGEYKQERESKVQKPEIGLMSRRQKQQEAPAEDNFYEDLLASYMLAAGPQQPTQSKEALASKPSTYGPRGPTSAFTGDEREILAKTLQAEAGGEGYEGMIAAGAVIRNRAESGNYGGKSIKGVIMKPGQFSAWNGVTGYAGGEGAIDMANIGVSEAAYAAADAILGGQYEDQTGGATHYYNPNVASPKWGGQGTGWVNIGNHRFGKADAGRG